MRFAVTGGAGFVGSHLCDALLARGDDVVAFDNLATGDLANLTHAHRSQRFTFIEADVSREIPVKGHLDGIFHMASPASPVHYARLPLETMAVGSRGTELAAEVAMRSARCRLIFASTSEVYGDPLTHPQSESDWGNVNPVGPRSVYDEAKRFGEALTSAYKRVHDLDSGIVRIFNTYGPRLQEGDGRVIPNFIVQALRGEPLTIYGDGRQTRSCCYVDDLVKGLILMMDLRGVAGPINIGNPEEHSVLELARLVTQTVGGPSEFRFLPLPEDDPKRRCPDITYAIQTLGWRPRVSLQEGITATVKWFAASSIDRKDQGNKVS